MFGLDKPKKEFIRLLENLKVEELSISDYNKIYLKKHLESLTYSVNLAWQILELGLKNSDKPIDKIAIAEIGGGTGIISLLAKWLGFEKVIYSDSYEQSCRDFRVISDTLGLKPDGIVCGSIDEIAAKYKNQIDVIVSRDVVEHIYDPGLFFKQSIENFKGAVMVHNTSANIYNIFKRGYFKKFQQLDEKYGNPNQFKPGDSLESFYEMRYKFIHSNFSKLPETTIGKLATNTRGKIYHDIYTEVKQFIETGRMPELLSHPTNTCDPANGNWTEHLLTFEEYNSFVEGFGYKTEWHFAPYDEWRNKGLKKAGLKFLNSVISNFKWLAKSVTPAVIMVSVPQSNNKHL